MSSAGRVSISSCFQHGLQHGYLSLKPHVKGGLFPLTGKEGIDRDFGSLLGLVISYIFSSTIH